jgi:hypothetical protein
MSPSRVAAIVALVGGLLWIAAAVLGWGADAKPLVYDAGLAAFLIALAGFGYSLVDHAPGWLRLVVSIATPLLGLMGWTMIIDALPSSNAVVVLVGGIALLVCGMIAIPRTRRIRADVHEPPVRGRRASHRLP